MKDCNIKPFMLREPLKKTMISQLGWGGGVCNAASPNCRRHIIGESSKGGGKDELLEPSPQQRGPQVGMKSSYGPSCPAWQRATLACAIFDIYDANSGLLKENHHIWVHLHSASLPLYL